MKNDIKKNIWIFLQTTLCAVAILIFCLLLLKPKLGLFIFWDVIITIAPALFVFGIGLWRNICPLGTISLVPRYLNLSKKIKIKQKTVKALHFISVILLLILAPLRHLIFDQNGFSTAILLVFVSFLAFILGLVFDSKSIWCSGLCPVFPVEKLYSINNSLSLTNAHCTTCSGCTSSCPDSKIEGPPFKDDFFLERLTKFFIVGAFPGFIWGWFQVPNISNNIILKLFISSYTFSVYGMVCSGVIYLVMKQLIEGRLLVKLFSATSISMYYWFKCSIIFKDSVKPNNIIGGLVVFFFFYWIVIRRPKNETWLIRPVSS